MILDFQHNSTHAAGSQVFVWTSPPVRIVLGPYSVAAAGVFMPGASFAETFIAGASESQTYMSGSVAGEAIRGIQ